MIDTKRKKRTLIDKGLLRVLIWMYLQTNIRKIKMISKEKRRTVEEIARLSHKIVYLLSELEKRNTEISKDVIERMIDRTDEELSDLLQQTCTDMLWRVR